MCVQLIGYQRLMSPRSFESEGRARQGFHGLRDGTIYHTSKYFISRSVDETIAAFHTAKKAENIQHSVAFQLL